ncbi:hypothetical protein JXR93_07185 [bacterium]|nr:hypothetical protein [bacterium]
MNIIDENSTKTFSQTKEFIKDRYIIQQEIYQNYKNSILLATDIFLEKDIIIKLSFSEMGNREIINEFKKIALFTHSSIIRGFDIQKLSINELNSDSIFIDKINSNGLFFYTMEYIKEDFDKNMIQNYIKQIFEAFYTIHNKNIVHNDIKLNNFIFSKNRVVLIDFSNSVVAEENAILLENHKLSRFIIQWINYMFNINILDEHKIGKKLLSDFYYKQIINFFNYKQDRIIIE